MATVVPPAGTSAPVSVATSKSIPVSPAQSETVPAAPSLLARLAKELNLTTVVGGIFVFAGGLMYASAEIAYANLAGATMFDAMGWIFYVEGIAYSLFGAGILLSFVGIADGLPSIGGGMAFFGSILLAMANIGYAAIRGQTSLSDQLWTNTVDAVGFLFLAFGIAVAFAGLAVLLPRGTRGAQPRR